MSTDLVASEIKRFLASTDAEVLCIKGKWGAGKTFAWRKYLSNAETAKAAAFSRYSYVSLFGLNSLEDLRYAIVEGSVLLAQSAEGPTIETMTAFLREKLGKAQPIFSTILASMGKKDVGSAIAKAAYLAVRKQLICFDDLERAGKGLEPRDVLGLASSLKEERGCKVVLLLNDEEMADDARQEFERQLEKVVDISLVFDPTSLEAATIALTKANPINPMLQDRIVQLGIVNIRVIKKIERLALLLVDILKDFSQPTVDQAVSAVTLGAWAILQPSEAPSLEYLRKYSRLQNGLHRPKEEDDQQVPDPPWRAKLDQYPFAYADDLDQLIFEGVKRGFFDKVAIVKAGRIAEKSLAESSENSSFAKAWGRLHGSFTLDDDEVLDELYTSAIENVSNLNAMNINSTIRLFREMARGEQADAILNAYITAHEDERAFFDLDNHHFTADDEIDPALRIRFLERYTTFVDNRDPRSVLLTITNSANWDDHDIQLLARLQTDEWVALFDGINGKVLPRAVKKALTLARHAGERSESFSNALCSALEQIAARSPLRAHRLRRFGISGV